MREDVEQLSERLLDFAVAVIQLVNRFPRTTVGRHVGGQLVRCATSAGANYEEARGAESLADFIHKMQVVLKELRESLFWLKVTARAELRPRSECEPLIKEADELCRVFVTSIVTARKRR